MLLTRDDVFKFLPHKEPFLFIDSVEKVSADNCKVDENGIVLNHKMAGIEIFASYKTKEDHPIFKGHFPGNPIFPGVCQVEMMAQATIFVVLKSEQNPFDLTLDVALLGVDKSRFRIPVLPGMKLDVHCKILRSRGHVLNSECKIFHQDKLVAQAEIMASLKMH